MADTRHSKSDPAKHGQIVLNYDGTNIGDSIPTSGNNPSLVLAYDGSGNLTTITKTIGAVQYRKTLAYTGSVLDSVSAWIQL